nr:pantetheine-phosphate adenylyltransferase [uncultured Prevotella sp.]
MRTAIFVGSFDPFTVGHDSIVRRALPLFDRLVIGVGVNVNKHYMWTAEERVAAIRQLYADEKAIEVKTYDDLTIDFARRENARFVVRGVRNVKDFEYERDIADANRALGGLETILLYADPALAYVSSSLMRELKRFGKEIQQPQSLPRPSQGGECLTENEKKR